MSLCLASSPQAVSPADRGQVLGAGPQDSWAGGHFMTPCAQPAFSLRELGFSGMMSWGCFWCWVASAHCDPSGGPSYPTPHLSVPVLSLLVTLAGPYDGAPGPGGLTSTRCLRTLEVEQGGQSHVGHRRRWETSAGYGFLVPGDTNVHPDQAAGSATPGASTNPALASLWLLALPALPSLPIALRRPSRPGPCRTYDPLLSSAENLVSFT